MTLSHLSLLEPDGQRTLTQLQIRETGAGQPVILVHGIQGTSAAWDPVLPYLSGHRLVLPNLPGRALSPRCPTHEPEALQAYYHLDHYADVLAALVQQCVRQHGGPVHLVGWSMGVSVILRLWARHAGQGVARQVLISGTPHAAQAHWFSSVDVVDVVAEAQARAQRLGLSEVADPMAVAWTWRSARALDQANVLDTIDRPTCVIHGELDQDSPLSHGQVLAQGIRGAQFQCLAGQAHAVLSSATAEVGASIQEFLG